MNQDKRRKEGNGFHTRFGELEGAVEEEEEEEEEEHEEEVQYHICDVGQELRKSIAKSLSDGTLISLH